MSQYGALGMARAGYSTPQIIQYYYSGATLAVMSMPTLRVWLTDDAAGTAGFVLPAGQPAIRINDNFGGGGYTLLPGSTDTAFSVRTEGAGISLYVGAARALGPVVGPLSIHMDAGIDTVPGSVVRSTTTGHGYRFGQLEVSRPSLTSANLRTVVRGISMEHFLYGLAEVPSSWHPEALQAQAEAARSYAASSALRNGQNRSGCSCAIKANVDEAYTGADNESTAWRGAVDRTAGIVATYANQPIQAFYSASSGGYTAASEDVFGGVLAYLKAVPDWGDRAASPYYNTRTIAATDLSLWLAVNPATNVGLLGSVEIVRTVGAGGRVRTGGVELIGSGGTKIVDGDTFRNAVNTGLDGAGRSREHLLSSMFRIGYAPFGFGFDGGSFIASAMDGPTQLVLSGAGLGSVVSLSEATGQPRSVFVAYPGFPGGVHVALCDLDGDGRPEVITGAGPGGGPHVRIFDQQGRDLGGWFAYPAGFSGGVWVACGDVLGTGRNQIITGAGPGGGPHVRVFDRFGTAVGGFFAYGSFAGGVRVAAADVEGDGRKEIVTGPGPGMAPQVVKFRPDGTQVGQPFLAYAQAWIGGVYVAGISSGGPADNVLTGAGEGGGSHVIVRRPDGTAISSSFAFVGPDQSGARVAAAGSSAVVAAGPSRFSLARTLP